MLHFLSVNTMKTIHLHNDLNRIVFDSATLLVSQPCERVNLVRNPICHLITIIFQMPVNKILLVHRLIASHLLPHQRRLFDNLGSTENKINPRPLSPFPQSVNNKIEKNQARVTHVIVMLFCDRCIGFVKFVNNLVNVSESHDEKKWNGIQRGVSEACETIYNPNKNL